MSKVIYATPPVSYDSGYPTVGQNRQYQVLKTPFFAYPVIPALAITMLIKDKNECLWVDAIADELNEVDFGRIIIQANPDYIIFEAPTPLIKRYWEIINGLKTHLPNIKIILCGEHVTALPDESKENCKADYIVQGGKWYYEVYKIVTGKDWPKDEPLPHIDRTATRWWLYGYKNGNFKFIPGTYIMAGQDCWHRPGCNFCSWAGYHPDYAVRKIDDVVTEIENLIDMGFKEIFDDSGTFPVGNWLRAFCQELIARKLYKYVTFGCNMRFGALSDGDFKLMNDAGFRMILWGLESVNQSTLDALNKGYKIESISHDLILAKAAGIHSHMAVMFGYPWESYADAKRTYDMLLFWLKKGWTWSAQGSICIPYPGTPLFKLCKENNLLLSEEWEEYDQRRAIMKVPYDEKLLFKFQRGIYNTSFHPKFIWHKLKAIRGIEDIKYYFRTGRKVYDRFGNFITLHRVSEDF